MNERFYTNTYNNKRERITLYEKYKFIERNETEVNGIWKGAHLLLFFLAFVFGSFCTFCFHMLMYLFDEKCVLFPKLLSLVSLRQNIVYEFIPENTINAATLPVDFISTQWVEKSACYLPTYVPLVSGIFGLVWTTMFLMCSSGSRVLTGLQRPWRILPPIFVFSIAMSCLCLYTSVVTHYGLYDLCMKLSQITGGTTCTYTVNVATLVYDRRIGGVYQATRLTILTAWMHTTCWMLSALVALLRVLLAVDFQLVRIKAELTGDIDKFLEENETQIRTISPELWASPMSSAASKSSVKVHFQKEYLVSKSLPGSDPNIAEVCNMLYLSDYSQRSSEMALVLSEKKRLDMHEIYKNVNREHLFIVQILYNILAEVTENTPFPSLSSSATSLESDSSLLNIVRQYGQEKITSQFLTTVDRNKSHTRLERNETNVITLQVKSSIESNLDDLNKDTTGTTPSITTEEDGTNSDLKQSSTTNYQPEFGDPGSSNNSNKTKKSNLKSATTQTKRKRRATATKVQIESKTSVMTSETKINVEKETQTRKKEKQD